MPPMDDRKRLEPVGTAASHLGNLLVHATQGASTPRETIFAFLEALLAMTKAQTEEVLADVAGENLRVKQDLAHAVDTIADTRQALSDAQGTIEHLKGQIEALSFAARKLSTRVQHDKDCDTLWGATNAEGKKYDCNCGLDITLEELRKLVAPASAKGLKMWTSSLVFGRPFERRAAKIRNPEQHHPGCNITMLAGPGKLSQCDCGVDAAKAAKT